MWYTDFSDRLEAWAILRTEAQSLPLVEALQKIMDEFKTNKRKLH